MPRRRGPMRAPEFWHAPPGLAAGLLAPLGAAWEAAARLRRERRTAVSRRRSRSICVGNLVAGGVGQDAGGAVARRAC